MLDSADFDFSSRDTKNIFLVGFYKLKFEPAHIILPDGTGRVRELLRDATGETLGLSVGETASLKQRRKQKQKVILLSRLVASAFLKFS